MSSGEEVNLTVETALEAFDFLNCEEEDEEEDDEVDGEIRAKRHPASPTTRFGGGVVVVVLVVIFVFCL